MAGHRAGVVSVESMYDKRSTGHAFALSLSSCAEPLCTESASTDHTARKEQDARNSDTFTPGLSPYSKALVTIMGRRRSDTNGRNKSRGSPEIWPGVASCSSLAWHRSLSRTH